MSADTSVLNASNLPSNVSDFPLADYFWTQTVAALSSGLPVPRLDVYFDGYRVFCLQADEQDLLLLDFEDELVDDDTISKRNFDFDVDDDEAPGESGRVFACELTGARASVDKAIELVCGFFDDKQQWYRTVHHKDYCANDQTQQPKMTVMVSRAIVRYDCTEYKVDRCYRNVYEERSLAKHSLSRQTERGEHLCMVGTTLLNWLRVLMHTVKK